MYEYIKGKYIGINKDYVIVENIIKESLKVLMG